MFWHLICVTASVASPIRKSVLLGGSHGLGRSMGSDGVGMLAAPLAPPFMPTIAYAPSLNSPIPRAASMPGARPRPQDTEPSRPLHCVASVLSPALPLGCQSPGTQKVKLEARTRRQGAAVDLTSGCAHRSAAKGLGADAGLVHPASESAAIARGRIAFRNGSPARERRLARWFQASGQRV